MTRTLLWRDMRALSKDLCETLSADHGKQDISLSYCLDVVGQINQRFEQPSNLPSTPFMEERGISNAFALGVQTPPGGGVLLGHTKPKGFFKKKQPLYLTPSGALDQVMIVGCVGSGKSETLNSLAVNAAEAGKGVFYMDGNGDNSMYAKIMSHLSGAGRVGDLRVINLMTGGRDIIGDKKISHTLDLFQGMDCQGLSEWMQQLTPRAREKDEQRLQQQLLRELCPLVSRLLFYWSIQTGKRMTPGIVCRALTYSGIRELVETLSEESRLAHRHLLKATQHAQGLECAALEALGAQLRPLVVSWGHVFDSDRPEVGVLDSFKQKHFVLVLAPAMERCHDTVQIITSAINASLYQAMKSLPFSGEFDHMIILDEFYYTMSDQLLYDLSGLRNRGCGLVWGAEKAPSNQQRNRWMTEERGTWHMPGTQIAMKQESDDMGYYQWQSTKHIALAAGPTVFGELESLFGGEGFVYSGREFHEVTLDYKEAKRMEKLFMPHVNPLEHAELALPGPLARQTQTSSHRDRDKQAIVLFGRLTEFEENNLGRGYPPKLSWCQETMARMMGFAHWHEAQIRCAPELE